MVKRGRAKLLLCKYGLKDTDDLVDGKSVISTSGTELEKAGLATTAAPAPARVPRVATPALATVSPLLSLLPRAARVLGHACCERGEARAATEQCTGCWAAHRRRRRRGQRRQFTRAFVNTSSCGPVAVWTHCSID